MATAHLISDAEQHRKISVEEYLHTSYRPDCDYVDGEVQERNLGEFDHATLQTFLGYLFTAKRSEWNVKAVTECRFQVKAMRFRIPDIAVVPRDMKVDRIIRQAPLLCIEILSPEDTWRRIEARLRDYFEAGVANVWVFDPESREAFVCDPNGRRKVEGNEMSIADTPIRFTLQEIFSILDE